MKRVVEFILMAMQVGNVILLKAGHIGATECGLFPHWLWTMEDKSYLIRIPEEEMGATMAIFLFQKLLFLDRIGQCFRNRPSRMTCSCFVI